MLILLKFLEITVCKSMEAEKSEREEKIDQEVYGSCQFTDENIQTMRIKGK
jgi:RNA polymerase-binding transcription factor DksA